MKVYAIALNTFREAVRNKILYSVLFFAVVLIAIASFLGAVSIAKQERVIKDFGLFALSFFGAIITIVAGTSLLNKELKQKTIYNILSKPVERWQFMLGKQLGLTVTVQLLVVLMGLALMAFVSLIEGAIDWRMLQAIYFILLEVWIIAGVTMFFSSLVVTTTLTGLFTLGTYLAGRSVQYLYHLVGDGSNQALTLVVKVLTYILPDLSLLNFNDTIVYGQWVGFSTCLYGGLYALAYGMVCLVLASLIFAKRELL